MSQKMAARHSAEQQDTLEAWVELAHKLGWPRVVITFYANEVVCRVEQYLGRKWVVGEGPDPLSALKAALTKIPK